MGGRRARLRQFGFEHVWATMAIVMGLFRTQKIVISRRLLWEIIGGTFGVIPSCRREQGTRLGTTIFTAMVIAARVLPLVQKAKYTKPHGELWLVGCGWLFVVGW